MSSSQTIGRRLRVLSERCILLIIVGLAIRTWAIGGWFVPYRIDGGSMAETLLGVHRDVVCAECGFHFVCGTELLPAQLRAVCPNCGFAHNDLKGLPDLTGDRLLLHRSAFDLRDPKLWEIVAFRNERDEGIQAKRVVGLPGELIEIRHGDIYANGQLRRKSLPLQRAMAIPVYDADCQATDDLAHPRRWRGPDRGSRWRSAGGRFAHPESSQQQPIDWLQYHHQRRTPNGFVEEPVSNLHGYNQTRPIRLEDTYPVTDLMLSFRWGHKSGQGSLWVRATDGQSTFLVRVTPEESSWDVQQTGQSDVLAKGRLPKRNEDLSVLVSLFDGQFLLAFDDRMAAACAYTPRQPRKPSSQPLAIGTDTLGVTIRGLRVYRDVHYAPPPGPVGRWGIDRPLRLKSGQFYVLGDNSPISQDSRTWAESPAVEAKWLLGRPWIVHFPAKAVQLFGREFQVPDPTKIRYIR